MLAPIRSRSLASRAVDGIVEAGVSQSGRQAGCDDMAIAMTRTALENSPYYAVGSLTQLLGDGISFVNDKVLVKDLEYLSSLEIRHGCALCSCVR